MVWNSPPDRGARRRQRSARVVAATTLVLIGALAVAATALLSTITTIVGAAMWAVAAVMAGVAGVAAVRIMLAEIEMTRREHAVERVSMARGHAESAARSAADQARVVESMRGALAGRDRENRELLVTLGFSEGRAYAAELRYRAEQQRVVRVQERVNELETSLAIQVAEELDELASWQGVSGVPVQGGDRVVDLMGWADRRHA